ncbi:MAG TPA: hypothetical protein VJ739_06655 [Gemmataceae bacterium]|nr:hypothetical protein [Gemmataceae bacterium]
MDPQDLSIMQSAGPEPVFDEVTHAFLCNSRDELLQRCRAGGLLEATDLGTNAPWLWKLVFQTRGLVREGGEPFAVEHHVIAVRFLPDYLRRADRFEMLALMEPRSAFHPNLAPPGICVQVRPGETLLEICESLHALLSWKLRQLAENDALNPAACAWGRAHLDELPIDRRPLFGRLLPISLEPVEAPS